MSFRVNVAVTLEQLERGAQLTGERVNDLEQVRLGAAPAVYGWLSVRDVARVVFATWRRRRVRRLHDVERAA